MPGDIKEANETERRRTRLIHYVGSGVFVLILIAALAGLFGKGPLSKATARARDDSVRAEYSRFIRFQDSAELNLKIAAEATKTGAIELRLSNTFIHASEIKRLD